MVVAVRRCAQQLACLAALAVACAGAPTEATTLAHETSTGATSGEPTTSTTSVETSTTDDPSTTTTTTSMPTSSDASSTTGTSDTSSSSDADESSSTGEPAECHPQLHEVFNDPQGSDDMLEWIELFNPCHEPVDLAQYSLGWGGGTYGQSLDLVGEIGVGECFVVGGPMTTATNFDPTFDQSIDFATDLENTTNGAADGIALFLGPAADIDKGSVPVDALIYGDENVSGLVDETGAVGEVDVPAGGQGEGYARVDPAVSPGTVMWTITAAPSPGVCPNPS